MSKNNYKYLAGAIALAAGLTVLPDVALAANDYTQAPAAVGFNLNSGKSLSSANNLEGMKDIKIDVAPSPEEHTQTVADAKRSQWDAAKPSDETITQWSNSYEGQTIVDVKYEGCSEDVLKTVEASRASKIGDKYTLPLLEKDVNNIYDTGYFYDIYPSFETAPEGVIIVYHLFETPVLTSIEITGNSEEPTEKLMKRLQQRPGDRLNRRALHEDVVSLQKQYVKDGYVMAKINDMAVGEDGKLVFKINEGLLEGFKIKGLTKTKEKVVMRELRTKVGKPLNKKDVVRSYQRLTNLGYFESVDVKPIPGVEPNACMLEIDLTEKNTGTFGIGAGYSSSDGVIGMISLGDSNFRGIGDSVNVLFTVSGSSTDARGYTFSYRRPWLDKKETALNFRIFNRTFEYDDYDTNGDLTEEFMRKNSGFELGFTRPQSEYSSNSIAFRNRNDTYDIHKGGQYDRSTWKDWKDANFGLTRSILFQHSTDTRDNYFYPTSGQKVVLSHEWAGLMGGDFKYHKFAIEDSRYWKVGRNQILALRGSYGHATSTLPAIAQYRLGGQDTIRGYKDDIFRGNSMFLGNLELRFPLGQKVKGAIFSDFGSAWESGWTPSKIHGSVGVGFMIETPIGPLRVDIGHGSQGNRLHFNVGTTF